ncbi:hypothetical protein DSL64_19370 [Dyadobacter luteus]|uniref:BioF2-like acetyltransferase domain-containing protein n=1 Tax=Dyadobacter luteus TaxID=2259619 RepID=A0A3D8Y8D8_9BACT|nr:GNAT family N-acetyltransferase [Dyadobacter luteus]REA58833.1 hypothetical protein DSL64_19370 [Dyadobacter luteus]
MPEYKNLKNNYYKIISNGNIEKNKVEFDIFLYLTTTHLTAQTRKPVIYFQFYRNTYPTPIAIFQCTAPLDGLCHSAPSAPFGSIQCQDDCSKEEIDYFIKSIIEQLNFRRVKNLQINHYAYCYSEPHAEVIASLYATNGFRCSKEKINHHIPVSAQHFRELIVPAEHRRLKKCERSALIAQMDTDSDPGKIYQFLSYCRQVKGYVLPLSQSQLTTLIVHFPNHVRTFSVQLAGKIIAMVVTIRVNSRILYNFLIDSLPEFNKYSPTVMLVNCVYQYCQQQKIEILDLGTSLDQSGREKASLIRFKENIGGVRSVKKSFCIRLN